MATRCLPNLSRPRRIAGKLPECHRAAHAARQQALPTPPAQTERRIEFKSCNRRESGRLDAASRSDVIGRAFDPDCPRTLRGYETGGQRKTGAIKPAPGMCLTCPTIPEISVDRPWRHADATPDGKVRRTAPSAADPDIAADLVASVPKADAFESGIGPSGEALRPAAVAHECSCRDLVRGENAEPVAVGNRRRGGIGCRTRKDNRIPIREWSKAYHSRRPRRPSHVRARTCSANGSFAMK